MSKAIILAVLMMAGTSYAQTAKERAIDGAFGDAATTLAATALGAIEGNPLGVGVLVLKAPMLDYIDTLPDSDQPSAYALQGSIWGAATVNNLCVVAAIVTGGSFSPVCLIAGGAYGFHVWNATQDEREFWSICARERLHWNKPNMTCIYKPVTKH